MVLNCRELGVGGVPVVIAHGLYGMSDNWVTVGRELAAKQKVYLLDMRNHGQSPHSEVHNYGAMADDILEFLNDRNIAKAVLMGHSMGGKAVMSFALMHPERVAQMIVVDISPRSYAGGRNYGQITTSHDVILKAMRETDFDRLTTRKEVEVYLTEAIGDIRVAQFLLKNVVKKESGRLGWLLNVDALSHQIDEVMAGVVIPENGVKPSFPAVFIKGELSPYMTDMDCFEAKRLFPGAEIVTISNAGHWVHAEQPELFVKTVMYFLG